MAWLAQRGRWLSYSVGMVITEAVHQHVLEIPASAWTPAVETSGEVRDGPGSPNSPVTCSTVGRKAWG
ncbi:hypothetical protein H4687_007722 [Streptomyces stelliscabiei]|uniref:Uncharacterized protein n=1 Tax=Streptomyces stelliscabiei TaxID=146820 RepID=A0A8I0PHF9_9ACTN|nr:hypothetical protein [Streptomyces stelliscabiei]